MTLLNDQQLALMLADRAMRGWGELGDVALGDMVKRYARTYLTRAEAVAGEARVLIRNVFVPTYGVPELEEELTLQGCSVRYMVDLGLGGDASDPTIGMVLVVRGQYASGVQALVIAAPSTWLHWGIEPDLVTRGAWPVTALTDMMMPGARRFDA